MKDTTKHIKDIIKNKKCSGLLLVLFTMLKVAIFITLLILCLGI